RVPQLADDRLDLGHRLGNGRLVVEPIDNSDLGARLNKTRDDGPTDETGTASDQDVFFRKLIHATNLRHRYAPSTSRSAIPPTAPAWSRRDTLAVAMRHRPDNAHSRGPLRARAPGEENL